MYQRRYHAVKITIIFKDCDKKKKINFRMADEFKEAVIKREAKKVIRERWPELCGRITKMEWRY